MADNTTLNTGTGGDLIATDELTTLNGGATSGVKVQRVKVGFGSDATLRDVDAANPLPVVPSDGTTQLKIRPASSGAPVATDTSIVVSLRDSLPAGSATVGNVGLIAGTAYAGRFRPTDGTNDATVKAASTTPVGTDTALVVTQRDPLPAGSNNIGTVGLNTGSNFVGKFRISDNTNDVAVRAGNSLPVASDVALVVTQRDDITIDNILGSLPTGTNTIGSVKLTDGLVSVSNRSDGYIKTTSEPTTLLYDTFETFDTVNIWDLGGTSIPTIVNGAAVLNAGSTASASSFGDSKPTFIPSTSAFLQYVVIAGVEATASTGCVRFLGLGAVTTPTISAPITNGVIFEFDTNNALLGSAYSNSVRTGSVTLTKPIDGAPHRYSILYKASRVYFEIDSIVVGTLSFPNSQVGLLSAVFGQVNSASVTGSPTMTLTRIGVGDTARNGTKIVDGNFPWRQVSVGKNGGMGTRGQGGPAITSNFAAAATGNTPSYDVSECGNVTFVIKNQVAGSAFTGSPVVVFEQSDDGVSWGPLAVTRGDTLQTVTSITVVPPGANTEIVFNTGAAGISFVRARVTTASATNGMSIVIQAGGHLYAPQVSTVDRKDIARIPVTFYVEALAGAAAEALITMSYSQSGAAITTGSSFTVPAGRTLRLTSISMSFVATTTTANTARIRVRANQTGAAVIGSPINMSFPRIGWQTATFVANECSTNTYQFPDGFEFTGGAGVGFTHQEAAANGTIDIMVTGFIY